MPFKNSISAFTFSWSVQCRWVHLNLYLERLSFSNCLALKTKIFSWQVVVRIMVQKLMMCYQKLGQLFDEETNARFKAMFCRSAIHLWKKKSFATLFECELLLASLKLLSENTCWNLPQIPSCYCAIRYSPVFITQWMQWECGFPYDFSGSHTVLCMHF